MEVNKKVRSGTTFCWLLCHILCVLSITVGVVMVLFFPEFFQNQMSKSLVLTEDSRSFSEWKQPTTPLYMDVYIFNWTNPYEIRNKTTKPKFQQLGPYRFREYPNKVNIKFYNENSTVSYNKFSKYFFDPEGSVGSLTDRWTTINMVALGAGNKADKWGFFPQKAASMALLTYKEEIHVTKSLRELLFEGYEDNMVTLSTMFSNDTPFKRVGYLISKNRTDHLSGLYNVHTGVDEISQLGSIRGYNNKMEFPFSNGECRKLRGSTGEFFPQNFSLNESVYLFTPEMCRSIPYEYEKDVTLHGLVGRRFSLGMKALDNGTFYPNNKCYASDDLMPSGQFNISACNYNFPIFMSLPHFYQADRSYTEAVEGMNPTKEKHENYITLEQKTGIPIEVTARFQTNLLLRDYGNYISLYQNAPRIFMPIFYVEQKFVMDSEKVDRIKVALNIPGIGQLIGVFLLGFGVVVILIRYFKTIIMTNSSHTDSTSQPLKSGAPTVIRDGETNPLMRV